MTKSGADHGDDRAANTHKANKHPQLWRHVFKPCGGGPSIPLNENLSFDTVDGHTRHSRLRAVFSADRVFEDDVKHYDVDMQVSKDREGATDDTTATWLTPVRHKVVQDDGTGLVGKLAGDISKTDTTITFISGAKFSNNDYVRIDSEVIQLGPKSTNIFTSCTREVLGTSKASHTSGAKIEKQDKQFTAEFPNIVKHYWYRWRVRAVGKCQGDWGPGTSTIGDDASRGWSVGVNPSNPETPPDVLNLVLELGEHEAFAGWDMPAEPFNNLIADLRVAYLRIALYRGSVSPSNIVREDKFMHGTDKSWKLPGHPDSATYNVKVWTIAHDGTQSSGVSASGVKVVVPAPATPSLAFDAHGPRHSIVRALATVTAVADPVDANIAHYLVDLVHKAGSGTISGNADNRETKVLRGGNAAAGAELTQIFRDIPRQDYVSVRAKAVDTAGKESAWSPWTPTPLQAHPTNTPPALTGVGAITSHRRVGIKWKVPMQGNLPNENVASIHVEVDDTSNAFTNLVDEAFKSPGHGSHRYAVSQADVSTTFYIRATPIDGAGNMGAPQGIGAATYLTAVSDDDSTPIGTIHHHGSSTPPGKWHECDGSSQLRAGTYAALFAVISTEWGSADGTHFNLPDLRNRQLFGSGSLNTHASDEGLTEGSRDQDHGIHGDAAHDHGSHHHGLHDTTNIKTDIPNGADQRSDIATGGSATVARGPHVHDFPGGTFTKDAVASSPGSDESLMPVHTPPATGAEVNEAASTTKGHHGHPHAAALAIIKYA